MRTTLLTLTASLAAVAAGCDSVHTGQPSDPPGPVELVRIMVQDAQPSGARGVAVDLLDTPGSPLSTAVACSDTEPCLPQFTMQGSNPDFSCTPAGVCNDPLTAGKAPLTPPETGLAGEAGGTMIRLVFNKLLAAGIETVAIDPAKLPGSNEAFALQPGILEVDDGAGQPVSGLAYWDPSGSPTTTSDPITEPFGPAIVFKPDALGPNATYTIRLTAAKLTDRHGNPLADATGNVVQGEYRKSFTTEDLVLVAATTATDVTAGGVTLTPDEILQLGFNAGVDAATVSCTAQNGNASVPTVAWSEAGSDQAACMSALDKTIVNIAAADALGAPTSWPAGSYTIRCSGHDAEGGAGTLAVAGSFTVAGAAMAGDPQSYTQHVVCK